MGTIKQAFDETYRDNSVDGVLSSGKHEPTKRDIRRTGTLIDNALTQLAMAFIADAAAVVHVSQSSLFTDLAPPDRSFGIVYDDTPEKIGVYIKSGASGSGSWTATGLMGAGPEGEPGPVGKSFLQTAIETGFVPAGTTEAQFIAAIVGVIQKDTQAARDAAKAFRDEAGASAIAAANLAGGYADALNSIPVKNDSAPDAEELTDLYGGILRRTDAAGEQYLPGLGGRSIQDAIRQGEASLNDGGGQRTGDLRQLEDSAGNVVERIDSRGACYIPGAPMSLQAAAGLPLQHRTRFPDPRDKLHASVRPLTAALVDEGLPFVPPPTWLVPNGYVVPDAIVSAFSVQGTTPRILDTPYGLGGLVHPNICEMRRPLMGYHYIMSETPHRNAAANEENPILYGTNDLKQFDRLPDGPPVFGLPLSSNGMYNSDDVLTYDPATGELILVWREVTQTGTKLHYRSTWNGYDWTPDKPVALGSEGHISPSILYDSRTSIWHMFVVMNKGIITHYTGPTRYGPWTSVGTDDLKTRFGIDIWHLEVKFIGEKFFLLAQVNLEVSNLYLGVSANGTTWAMGPGLIQPQIPNVYKGSFLPEFDGGRMRLHVLWNIYAFPLPAGVNPAFYCEPTNWVTLSEIGA